MPKKKEVKHEIRSLDDLVNLITEDNIDMLFGNFYGTLLQYVKMKKEHPKLKYIGFDWIDDGKIEIRKAKITIAMEKQKNMPKSFTTDASFQGGNCAQKLVIGKFYSINIICCIDDTVNIIVKAPHYILNYIDMEHFLRSWWIQDLNKKLGLI